MMTEEFTDCTLCDGYPVRKILPDEETKKLIAGELEGRLGPIEILGIIAANVSRDQNHLGVLFANMNSFKLDHFGDTALNTATYNSFDRLKSALTPARISYKEGKDPGRFDMIVYKRKTNPQ